MRVRYHGRELASPWVHVLALSGVTLAVLLEYGLWEYPIVVDRAYFTYLGQAILRGEPIYHTTFFGYLPLPSLLSAASMWIGRPQKAVSIFDGMRKCLMFSVSTSFVGRRRL